mmetsp:Transcript_115166/g.221952  ORF Transcript_115166/g.221952 Transcript_115166/m.221952 type:complete len:218 (+) Transcript_115166:49-702(+)
MAKRGIQQASKSGNSGGKAARLCHASACADVVVTFGGGEESMVSSHVLRLASPVFEAMFNSEMLESQSKRLSVEVASKEDFDAFYAMLEPVSARKRRVLESDLPGILTLSDYYEVDALREECEDLMTKMKPSIWLLVLSSKHQILTVYERCADVVAAGLHNFTLDELQEHPRVMMDILQRVQTKVKAAASLRPVLTEVRHYQTEVQLHTQKTPWSAV